MGGGQEETQGDGDLAPLTIWLPLAPDLRGRLSRVFALTQGSPTSCWHLHPPSPYPFHRLHGPHPGARGRVGLGQGRGSRAPTAPPTSQETRSRRKSCSQVRSKPSHRLRPQAPPRAASTAPPKAPPLVFTTRVVQAASCTQAPPMPRP